MTKKLQPLALPPKPVKKTQPVVLTKFYAIMFFIRQKRIVVQKVTRAHVEVQDDGKRIYWNPITYDRVDNHKGKPITFEAFDRTWTIYFNHRLNTSWLALSPHDGDRSLEGPGTANVATIPPWLEEVFLGMVAKK